MDEKKQDVGSMVREWLLKNNFTGLRSPYSDCWCGVGEPLGCPKCDEVPTDCVAAFPFSDKEVG
jgi:hypothetical protein